MLETSKVHVPVMLREVFARLNIKEDRVYVDCTFGNGGHSRAILERLKKGKLVAFEWDKESFLIVKNDAFFSSSQFYLINDNFTTLEESLKNLNLLKEVDGFLFDLGLSSYQLAKEY